MACPECGKSVPPDSKFCLECGYDLRKPREIPVVDFRQFHSYTPKHLADKIPTRTSRNQDADIQNGLRTPPLVQVHGVFFD